MNKTVRLHNLVKSTTVLGPGKRVAIWLQGCMRNCPGCMSPNSRPLDGGENIEIKKLVEVILSSKDVEGITISGGEPFLQVDALFEILKLIRESSNMSVIIYTGYTLTELLEKNNPKIEKMLADMIDVLIDGEYIQELNDGVALRGSSNQVVHFLSDRYKNKKELYQSKNRNVEVLVSQKDMLFVGIPEKETLETWRHASSVLNK